MMPIEEAEFPVFHKDPDFNFESSDLEVLVNLKTFVDKSLMIKHVFDKKMILITVPHHFGKSTNLDMIKKFVEIQVDNDGKQIDNKTSTNRVIFEKNNLQIFRMHRKFFEKHFATFPVIYVNFKPVTGDSSEQILENLRSTLHTTFKNHKYLLTNDKLENNKKEHFKKFYDSESHTKLTEHDITTGLKFLSECLYQYFGTEVFVLIDEYDAPINQAILYKNIDLEQINKLMSEIFGNVLQDNKFVARAFLTGTSYFASVELSEINNMEKFMFLGDHEFVPFYGLTKKELGELLIRFELNYEIEREAILYYNGYKSKNDTIIFSIWSILKFLHYGEYRFYWESPESLRCLESAIYIPAIRTHAKVLFRGMRIAIEILDQIELQHLITIRDICSKDNSKIVERPDLMFSHLFHQGYLSIVEYKEDNVYKVEVPRNEISHIINEALENQFDDNIYELEQKCADSFNRLSLDLGDLVFVDFLDYFNNLLSEIKKSGKLFDYGENIYNCIVFCFLTKSKVRFARDFTFEIVKSGCPEFILLKRRTVIIIKITYNESAEEALKKIKNRCYDKAFQTHRKFFTKLKYTCIGINVSEDNEISMSLCKKNVEGFYARRSFPNEY
ncbi:hypothetical protein PV327_006491 [Microctonus hyperodae]|uniref:AAA-ATPase-like domain-containing protein n=1 Tax=Microctonus hyperodae TaxID=165561 RepID=A0AA39F4G7_MICHY|nr:hypothetical protein PV327_006491 [Microctonus hyperodae]